MNEIIGLPDIRQELQAGSKVLLLVRHAERKHIDNEDPTFGAAIPITENGMRMSEAFGMALKNSTQSVQFRASPLLRTVMTAQYIAKGMGLASPDITPDARIGNDSAFVADKFAIWQLFRDGSFFRQMLSYLQRGEQTGFAPLDAAAGQYEEYVLSRQKAQLAIFTTHDVFVAVYLHAKKVKTDWTPQNWPCFMDSAAIITDTAGHRRYAFLRAGLSNNAVGVD